LIVLALLEWRWKIYKQIYGQWWRNCHTIRYLLSCRNHQGWKLTYFADK
jgi:hypothetical protein